MRLSETYQAVNLWLVRGARHRFQLTTVSMDVILKRGSVKIMDHVCDLAEHLPQTISACASFQSPPQVVRGRLARRQPGL